MRLIDADAMKDDVEWQTNLLRTMFNGDEGMLYLADIMRKGYMAQIDKMPTIESPQWIPCSEGPPKKRDWYLGMFKEPDTGWINPIPFICDYLLGTKTKATTKEGWILKGFTDREEYIDYYFNLECVAWMPLPEPWRGDAE